MQKNTPLIKVIVVAGIVALLGYIGLDIPKEYIEDAVDTQFESVVVEKPGVTLQAFSESYEVVSVIDGDTVQLLIDGQKETIRVLGIDTPETQYSSRGAECYSAEASEYARVLLEDAVVRIATDSTQDATDKYDRILAYIELEDGTDFGELMLRDGYAEEFTFNIPYKNQSLYRATEKTAREEGMGLWSECS
ncbi:MAG: micrococcal nuclease [Patiriisocius sp.]|jgi:micrococcal nuclease